MKKPVDFRLIIIAWNIIACIAGLSLYVLSVSWTMGSTYEEASETWGLVIMAAPGVALVLFIIMFYIMAPLKKYVSLYNGNEPVEEELYLKARKVSLKLTVVILACNLAGFFIGPHVGLLIGFIRDDLYPDWLGHHLSNLTICMAFGFMTGVFAIFITNIILARYKLMLSMHTIFRDKGEKELTFKSKALIVFIALFLLGNVTTLFVANTENMKARFIYESIKKLDEKKAIIEEVDSYLSRRSDLPAFIFTYVPISLVISALLWFLFTQDHLKQIRLLKEKCLDITKGRKDLSRRLNLIAFDEVGELAVVINDFIDYVKAMLIDTKNVFDEVLKSNEFIDEIASKSHTVIKSISDSSHQIGSSIDRQKAVFRESDQTLSEMVDSFEKMAESIDNQSGYVESTSAVIEEVASNINSVAQTSRKAEDLSIRLKNSAARGNESVVNSIEAIKFIEETSGHVEEIITVINSIADQTNLLGMNAAIEAAQAGQAGRGFSVVADEIRKLADDTASSAKEIIAHIKDMSERISTGIRLSDEAGHSLHEIMDDVVKTTSLINEINNAMNEQNKGVENILSAISSLIDATNLIQKIAEEERTGNVKVKGTIKDLVSTYQDVIGLIELQIGQSKTIVSSVESITSAIDKNKSVILESKGFIEEFKLQ